MSTARMYPLRNSAMIGLTKKVWLAQLPVDGGI